MGLCPFAVTHQLVNKQYGCPRANNLCRVDQIHEILPRTKEILCSPRIDKYLLNGKLFHFLVRFALAIFKLEILL